MGVIGRKKDVSVMASVLMLVREMSKPPIPVCCLTQAVSNIPEDLEDLLSQEEEKNFNNGH